MSANVNKKINMIRNFAIIAHIDHGKSTLADRVLEMTGSIKRGKNHDRMLDTLELEQERGITIKLQTARILYKDYILNLVDTPGHVDFSYEVSRALAACEGAILLVDATQGIQAQTLSTVYQALEHNLTLIPVINKIDLPNADIQSAEAEIQEVFGFKKEEIIYTSGKTGDGVQELLDAIVERIPAPKVIDTAEVTKGLIFDSFYHEHKGVVALVRLFEGEINANNKLYFYATKTKVEPIEIGFVKPDLESVKEIKCGEIGYLATGLKDINLIRTGDTVTIAGADLTTFKPLDGYQKPKPMVYAGLYPSDAKDQNDFREAIEKLGLNDAAFTYSPDNSPALGFGYRCGFLGLLHLEIVQQRIKREFDLEIITSAPTVEYRYKLTGDTNSYPDEIELKVIDSDTNLKTVNSPLDLPDPSKIDSIYEPIAKVEILTPETYIGALMELAQAKRGIYINTDYLSGNDGSKVNVARRYVILQYHIPLSELITDFFDKLKSASSGFASLDYSVIKYQKSEIVKLDFMINHEVLESLSVLVFSEDAISIGKKIVQNLTEAIPRQQFKIPIQAAIGGKVVAREDIPAYRKDVTAKLYGGDYTRKMKLLQKQKKGKKKMEKIGKVEIPEEAFLATIKR